MASLVIAVEFPDNSIVSYDRAHRVLILTMSSGATLSVSSLPARPNPPGSGGVSDVDAPLVPTSKKATTLKLGWKKIPIIGTAIWKPKFVSLTEKTITYHEREGSPALNTIVLTPSVEVRVIQTHDPARKDRYEDGDNSLFGMLSQPIGAMMNPYSGPIGKPNCVECHVPAQVGNLMNTVASNNIAGLAFGGGIAKARSRTFYFSFPSLQDANSFAAAIQNNVDIIAKTSPIGGKADNPKAGNFAGLDALVNQSYALKANQKLMVDPNTSLEWYKVSLNSSLSGHELYEKLIRFYDQLAAVNVHPSY